jgi:DNA-binding transcriptional LysR family regulator
VGNRAVEILGLQQQTAIEVTEAAHGRRLLRIAASSAFAEHAAPGLIDLFSSRADDLFVQLSVHPTSRSADLIPTRVVDVAIGPASESSFGSDG